VPTVTIKEAYVAIPGIPNNYILQTGNRTNFLSWDLMPGATSYSVQVSTDGINYTLLASPTTNNYLDAAVSVGVKYYYQVASTNVSGTSPYTSPLSIIPAPTAEMSLGQMRELAKQRADMVNSQFVTDKEWNNFINLAMFELYDLIVTVYEDYFMATPVIFTAQPNQYLYPLPDGALSFINGVTNAIGYIAPAYYKLKGVDLGLNTTNNAWVTINKFNFADRNKFVYPNTASTIYGVFNLQYRVIGNNIEFVPTPSAGQIIRLWYTPRLSTLLQDTDVSTIGYSGWLEYVILRAAKYALDKEESDSSAITQEIIFIKTRIEESASNRDDAMPDKVSDVRSNGGWSGSGGFGWGGGIGGF
jgi:hypothetical protein